MINECEYFNEWAKNHFPYSVSRTPYPWEKDERSNCKMCKPVTRKNKNVIANIPETENGGEIK